MGRNGETSPRHTHRCSTLVARVLVRKHATLMSVRTDIIGHLLRARYSALVFFRMVEAWSDLTGNKPSNE